MKSESISKSPSRTGMDENLPARITKTGSKQTYYTFRLLVERQNLQNALRAYAYFRWVDDQLDCNIGTREEKISFLEHQRELMEACYRKEYPSVSCPEEQMVVDMIVTDHRANSGLSVYLQNMMAVMSFDVHRKGEFITNSELTQYSHMLSVAVTELLFNLLTHESLPQNEDRYQAVRGAHIVHMLRDMWEDIDLGYINVPAEVLKSGQVSLDNLDETTMRRWVLQRVKLAGQCFRVGRRYFSKVKSLRCRLAAYAYLARFEWMLQVIQSDGYRLRRAYPERKSLRTGIWMARRVLLSLVDNSALERTDGQMYPSELFEE